MNINIVARNLTPRSQLKERIEKKLGKLDKYFERDADAKVVMRIEKDKHIMEITLSDAGMIFRVQQSAEDMITALDQCAEVLERKICKNKTKLEKRMRKGAFDQLPEFDFSYGEDNDYIKTKTFAVKPMIIDEAILQMEMLGHNFFVYRDAESEQINVIYKRKDGGYGHIVPV